MSDSQSIIDINDHLASLLLKSHQNNVNKLIFTYVPLQFTNESIIIRVVAGNDGGITIQGLGQYIEDILILKFNSKELDFLSTEYFNICLRITQDVKKNEDPLKDSVSPKVRWLFIALLLMLKQQW